MAGPWEKYQTAAPVEEGPWTKYGNAPAPEPAPAQPSVVEDVAGSIQGGIIRGAASLPGLPGMVAELTDRGADWLARNTVGRAINVATGKGNVADERPYAPLPGSPAAVLPKPEDTIKAVEGVIGETHRPQTMPGEYAATVGEFVGSGARALPAIVGGVASEAAGQATEGTALETPARIAAGVAAPVLAGRAITPVRTDPARIPATDRMAAEGVELTAGQRTGSKPLQWLESTAADLPGTGRGVAERMEAQGQQFNRAVARRMGEDADMLTPDVMQRAADRIGGEFRRLSANNTLHGDQQFLGDVVRTVQDFAPTLPAAQQATFQNWLNHIGGQFGNGRTMTGEAYQRLRSRLGRNADGLSQNDPEMSRALRGLRDALDDAMGRSVRPQDADAWQAARQQYGNMKDIERAMASAGEKIAQGYASPSHVRTAAASRNRPGYVRGQSDLGELGRAAEATMRPLPQSGTTPRAFFQGLLTGGGGAAGFMTGGAPEALAAMAGSVAAPAVAGRVLMSPPVQTYLGNRVIGPNPNRLQQILLNAQAGYRSGED